MREGFQTRPLGGSHKISLTNKVVWSDSKVGSAKCRRDPGVPQQSLKFSRGFQWESVVLNTGQQTSEEPRSDSTRRNILLTRPHETSWCSGVLSWRKCQSWTQSSVDGYGSAPCSAAFVYSPGAMNVCPLISAMIMYGM